MEGTERILPGEFGKAAHESSNRGRQSCDGFDMFKKLDAVRLHVHSIDDALKFYREALGQQLAWRIKDDSAAVRLEDTDTEIVLVREQINLEVDFLVDSVETSLPSFEKAGGKVIVPTFDIPIGKCALVEDPWGNRLVMLDMTKGSLKTDALGNVIHKP